MRRFSRRLVRPLALAAAAAAVAGLALAIAAGRHLEPVPEALPPAAVDDGAPRLTDRHGEPLSYSFARTWNQHDQLPFHAFPKLLVDAVVMAEDQRFFDHDGVDWKARGAALVSAVRAGRVVRGASTISEQAARMITPRPRTAFSRWLKGLEARRLERRFSKDRILEFYLNQVPYARQRRGVVQAARTYFGRDLDTLSVKETLALAVLVRSPSRLDLLKDRKAPETRIRVLAERMHRAGLLSAAELDAALTEELSLGEPMPMVDAVHFVRTQREGLAGGEIPTTLDGTLQSRLQGILDRRIEDLSDKGVTDGALLAVDHTNGEILAWVNGRGFGDHPGGQIDKVVMPRQPGSTLKPFVYALALERGWNAATLIDDAPLAAAVGHGQHSFRNYSRVFYGPLRLRETLANSLNVPAVKALRQAGRSETLERFRALGFSALDQHPDFYGDGLALGTGEVTLHDLVRAYTALARVGVSTELRWRADEGPEDGTRRIFDAEVASLISSILSDPKARQLEFGSLLDLPAQTAVKTGTSNDHHDAWAVGYSHRWVVGVWMGTVDRRPMDGISGSSGPGLVLRAAFAELGRHRRSEPLFLSRELVRRPVCRTSGLVPSDRCPELEEWFRPAFAPTARCPHHGTEHMVAAASSPDVRLISPTPGLHLARDPRIPDALEIFAMEVSGAERAQRIEWIVDGEIAAVTEGDESYHWPLSPGRHTARARVFFAGAEAPAETHEVGFLVK